MSGQYLMVKQQNSFYCGYLCQIWQTLYRYRTHRNGSVRICRQTEMIIPFFLVTSMKTFWFWFSYCQSIWGITAPFFLISDSYHTPHPGMPMLWMMLMPTWAMNTKKNSMKLKELSFLRKTQKFNKHLYLHSPKAMCTPICTFQLFGWNMGGLGIENVENHCSKQQSFSLIVIWWLRRNTRRPRR